jgi:tRNA(Ile)-lysidine synthetase-like protein
MWACPTYPARYYVSVHPVAQRVLSHIRHKELLHAGDRVGIAVSGGIDSVALLRLMLELRGELGIVLSVIHFNHKLRGAESDADERFVANLAREHGLEFRSDTDDVAQHAAHEHIGIEAAARELRYGFFRSLLGEESTLGAKAPLHEEDSYRRAGSAAPPKDDPQGLKPTSFGAANGTAEAVPFPDNGGLRGPEGPLFHVTPDVTDVASGGADEGAHVCNPLAAQWQTLDKIATGHTLDDQAETVLMRMIRGSGTRGLGGIYPRIAVEYDHEEVSGEIIRPLLAFRRRELRRYLEEIAQAWREDSSNADDSFTRNRVRQLVVPLLEAEFNPSVAENLAELADMARVEEDYWENEVAGWMGTAVHWSPPEWARALSRPTDLVQISAADAKKGERPHLWQNRPEVGHPSLSYNLLHSKIEAASWLVMNATVDRLWFLGEPLAVQRRLVKAIGEQAGIPLEFKHVEEIVRFAANDPSSDRQLSLPLGWKVSCTNDELIFLTPNLREKQTVRDYDYELSIPGKASIPEIRLIIEARLISTTATPKKSEEYNSDCLLNAASLPRQLRVRNWRPGDRFWPAHTKSPKKIKELLQERHVPQPERKLWPVVVNGNTDEIVWMRGFPVPAKLRAQPGEAAILITENSINDSSQKQPRK